MPRVSVLITLQIGAGRAEEWGHGVQRPGRGDEEEEEEEEEGRLGGERWRSGWRWRGRGL